MRPLLVLLTMLVLSGCLKRMDNTNQTCTSDCTLIQGQVTSENNHPVQNVPVSLTYQRKTGTFESYTRRITNAKTDQNGYYKLNFHLNDDELKDTGTGYLSIDIDKQSFDPNTYLVPDNGVPTFNTAIYSISTRDTIINQNFYMPVKAVIMVHLKDFKPLATGDLFQAEALYPFGWNMNYPNQFLGGFFSTGATGQAGEYAATSDNYIATIPVAANDTCVIRIRRIKNAVNTVEDIRTSIQANATREYTFSY